MKNGGNGKSLLDLNPNKLYLSFCAQMTMQSFIEIDPKLRPYRSDDRHTRTHTDRDRQTYRQTQVIS